LENLVIRIEAASSMVPGEREVNAAAGLKGGGDLLVDRTIALDLGALGSLTAAQFDGALDRFVVQDASADLPKKVTRDALATILSQAPSLRKRKSRAYFGEQS